MSKLKLSGSNLCAAILILVGFVGLMLWGLVSNGITASGIGLIAFVFIGVDILVAVYNWDKNRILAETLSTIALFTTCAIVFPVLSFEFEFFPKTTSEWASSGWFLLEIVYMVGGVTAMNEFKISSMGAPVAVGLTFWLIQFARIISGNTFSKTGFRYVVCSGILVAIALYVEQNKIRPGLSFWLYTAGLLLSVFASLYAWNDELGPINVFGWVSSAMAAFVLYVIYNKKVFVYLTWIPAVSLFLLYGLGNGIAGILVMAIVVGTLVLIGSNFSIREMVIKCLPPDCRMWIDPQVKDHFSKGKSLAKEQ